MREREREREREQKEGDKRRDCICKYDVRYIFVENRKRFEKLSGSFPPSLSDSFIHTFTVSAMVLVFFSLGVSAVSWRVFPRCLLPTISLPSAAVAAMVLVLVSFGLAAGSVGGGY